MVTVEELVEMAKVANGRRRNRIVGKAEAKRFVELLAEVENDPDARQIRVYSRGGFVANSYNFRAVISVFVAERDAEGKWVVGCRTVDAKRGHGQGALETVNGRAV